MATALVQSRAQLGLQAPAVSVEVHLPSGLPGFSTTGINGNELRDRVKSAIQNSAFEFPAGRIVVNLGPAELHKSGGRYDLAIAAGILIASGQLPAAALKGLDLLGELSLFGDVRPVRGALTAARETEASGRRLLCPAANGPEFGLYSGTHVKLISHLNQLANPLRWQGPVTDIAGRKLSATQRSQHIPSREVIDPLRSVVGQERAKRALTIAAAGGHHMLMIGPPGAGKTMLAARLRDLLPPLSPGHRTEVAEIYSLSGQLNEADGRAPFRAPHHSASCAAITGGGSPPQPGEISHAHNGVLFMDEMPEFRRDVIEALREPLEDGRIRLNRRGFAVEYPARFQLVAAMNPCPVGLVCKPISCRCPPDQAQRYRNRISAPILDRIDLHIEVQAVPVAALLGHDDPRQSPDFPTGSSTSQSPKTTGLPAGYPRAIRMARSLQLRRSNCLNAHLDPQQTEDLCACDAGVTSLLQRVADRFELSARSYFRTLRVARTITDLDAIELPDRADKAWVENQASSALGTDHAVRPVPITESAIAEALSYRPLTPERAP